MSTQGPVVRFAAFEFDRRSGELRRNGHRVRLQGQPAQVLCHLVQLLRDRDERFRLEPER